MSIYLIKKNIIPWDIGKSKYAIGIVWVSLISVFGK